MARRIMVLLATCAVCLACAAPAQADLLVEIGKDYTDDGRLNPCKYSEKELRDLKGALPNDLEQYSDFGVAIDDALAKRAQGACNKSPTPAQDTTVAPPAANTAGPPPPSGTAKATASAPPAPAAAQPPPTPNVAPTAAPDVAAVDSIGLAARSTDAATDPPFPLIAMAILAGLLALATLTFGLVRWRAWEPAWVDGFRHAVGEAGWRASSTWTEFTDFVRFGR
ncbi:MAG TPA: hypothetical protein VNA28_11200 [Solirubrobacteraceae bacterium]|nr:hypothetical protein [Solirubrobacteraceae bacterium]